MWLVSWVMAAPIAVRVTGVGTATAVQTLVRTGNKLYVRNCNDAATPPDIDVDGIWNCEPIDTPEPAVDVLALVEGRLYPGGVLSWPEGARRDAALQIQLGRMTASTDPRLLPVPGAHPAGPVSTVLVRLLHYGAGPAPMLELNQDSLHRQLSCHDDGSFPDAVRNDGNPTCVGGFPSDTATVTLRGTDSLSFGSVTWPAGPLHYLSLDIDKKKADTSVFDLTLPPMGPLPRDSTAAESSSIRTRSEAPVIVGRPVPTVRAVAPWLLGMATLGVALGWVQRRQMENKKTLALLRPHAAPPLFPGGPSWADPAAILRVECPEQFVGEILEVLSASRRIVLVTPENLTIPPAAGVWAGPRDWIELRAALGALAGSEGAPVALLMVGARTLLDPGAVVRDPLPALLQSLPPGLGCWLVVRPEEQVAAWVPTWTVRGPPWEGHS